MPAKIRLSHSEYTVGWICALPLEMAAATVMLDEVHENLPTQPTDHNSYTLGRIGKHNVVVACLPAGGSGIAPAATVAMQLSSSFQSIRFGLLVGIGGGVPNTGLDIRLGDVVVSQPTGTHGGVIEYDYGKALNGGNFERKGMLNCPPLILRTALSKLQASHHIKDSQVMGFLAEMKGKISEHNTTKFARPTQPDHLYLTDYNHVNVNSKTCAGCDMRNTVLRPPRNHDRPVIHYGLIASANQVMKDGRRRDQLAQEFGVYCVEMEAAGLNDFPCLVIRGVSDYADSHKNDEWQGYAATVAAAYAKELLFMVEISHTNTFPERVKETMSPDPMVVTATPKTPDLSGLSLDRSKFQDDIQENTVPDKDKHTLSAIDLTNDDSTIRATPRQSSQNETRHPERAQNNNIKNDGYTLKGHSGLVTSVAFSPDGKTIGSGSLDHTVRLWNTATNATSLILSNHSDRVDTVLFSPDGKRLASVSRDRTVWLWDSLTGAKIFMLNGHDDRVNTMGFSTDGTLLASGTLGKEVKLWDTATGSTRRISKHPGSLLTAVAFSSDRMVASEICNGNSKLWNSTTGEFQPMGTLNGQVNHMVFSADGSTLACEVQGKIILWDTTTCAVHATLKGHSKKINTMSFSPDGKVVATASSDRTVKLWDTTTGVTTYILRGHSDRVNAVVFSPDGTLVASGSDDKTVILWKVSTGVKVCKLTGYWGKNSLVFSPDGKLLAYPYGQCIKIWNIIT